MATFESRYTSLLQGVSQQIPRLRLPGQVCAQENKLSDMVTGVRRRPGAEYLSGFPMPGEDHTTVSAWDTDIGGSRVQVLVGTATGTVTLLGTSGEVLATLSSTYLQAGSVRSVRSATVGDEFFLLNTERTPTLNPVTGGVPPTRRGSFYVLAGAYSKTYSVTVKTGMGEFTATYTTPSGSGSGDAANTLPTKIATELATALQAQESALGITVYRTDAFVYIQGVAGAATVVVSSNAGTTYMIASAASRVRQDSYLPAILPPEADGYIVAVGETRLSRYFRYDAAGVAWQESGDASSPSGISGMPVAVVKEGASWQIKATPFEGRLAGDDETNPIPEFRERGLTGIGAFQGRLVLLSGSQVFLSSSKNPRRFMRSTVTSLLAEDPIGIGASANSSAPYEYAIPFQKDLLLFSDKYQALIPSNGQAVTPANATVVITSTLSMDMNTAPIPIGRTLLFAAPRSQDFFGVTGMVASQYSDAQYVFHAATDHLPKYMGGHCRFGAASSVSSMVVFGPSGDPNSLIVHEYAWSGEEKVQQSWHTWRFPYPIASAYFSEDSVRLLFVREGRCILAQVSPKQGVLTKEGAERPLLDLYFPATVEDNHMFFPGELTNFDEDMHSRVKLSLATGPASGSWAGIEETIPGVIRTVRSVKDAEVYCGIPYRSVFSPSPVMVMDHNGVKIDSQKVTVLRYGISTQNSTKYQVTVSDKQTTAPYTIDQGTLFYSSVELELGSALRNDESRAVVPARTNADSTTLLMESEGTGDMCVVGIDYVFRTRQKIRRF